MERQLNTAQAASPSNSSIHCISPNHGGMKCSGMVSAAPTAASGAGPDHFLPAAEHHEGPNK
eukprot:5099568-Prorocentrum_lima.AAC.1